MTFNSFNINALNPKYTGIDDHNSIIDITLKYFIAGQGRCSGGQCGGENMKFFMQIKDSNNNDHVFQKNVQISAFDGEVKFSETLPISDNRITVELFMWDQNNIAMSSKFPFFLDRIVPIPPPPPTIINFSVVATFPDNHTVLAVLDQNNHNDLANFLPIAGVQIRSDATENSVTKILSRFLNEIEAHRILDLPLPPLECEDGFHEENGVCVPDDIPPTPPDQTITDKMVTQSIRAFQIVESENRIKGSIDYIATNEFNPFFFSKEIISIITLKDESGNDLILPKINSLFFFETERDETIFLDEDIGNTDKVKMEFFVWDSISNAIPFSKKKSIIVTRGLPPPPDPPDDPNGESDFLTKLATGGILAIMLGGIFGGKNNA